jgi:hypothetical protein
LLRQSRMAHLPLRDKVLLLCGASWRSVSVLDLLLPAVVLVVAGVPLLLARDGGTPAVAFDVHLQDDGVVDQAIDSGECHSGIGEDACPFAEGLIGGDEQAAPFVAGERLPFILMSPLALTSNGGLG